MGWEAAVRRFEQRLPLETRRVIRTRMPEAFPDRRPAWGEHLTLVALDHDEMTALRAYWDQRASNKEPAHAAAVAPAR